MANTLEIIIKATDKASKEIAGVTKGISGLGSAASAIGKGLAIGMAGAVTAVTAVGAALGKLAIDAMPLQGIEAAFGGITGASEEMLAALRKGSLGMVTDRELMRNYNQAAQLVSTTFADQLPDAMKYLAKVSAATGQDMGFMLDSLTKGVGRMSPMILDNLGIQVSLEEATAEAAAMFGVEADALTKTQLQAGMMNVVMRALERNTAKMPEIAGTAAQRWAALGVTFKNVKDQIGSAFIPMLEGAMTAVEGLTTRFLPPLVEWFERLGEKLAPAAEAFGRFITEISTEGYDKVESFKNLLWGLLPPELAKGAVGAVTWVQNIVTAIEEGDWSTAGGMIWDQIVTGFTKAVDFGKMIDGALGASTYTFTDRGLVKSNVWADMADKIMTQIATGLVSASGKLLEWVSNPQTVEAMGAAGHSIGKAVGAAIAAFFGLSGSVEETDTSTAIEGMMDRVRANVAETLRGIGRAMGGEVFAGIVEGLTGKTPEEAVQNAIETTLENATPGESFWAKLGRIYGEWYSKLPGWWTGGTGWMEGTSGAATGPRAEDVYNFEQRTPANAASALGATRGGGTLPVNNFWAYHNQTAGIPLGGNAYTNPGGIATGSAGILDLSTVPDLVDNFVETIVLEVQRRRRVEEAAGRAEAPVRDVNLTIYTQSARTEDIQIGVMRALRAQGVGVR